MTTYPKSCIAEQYIDDVLEGRITSGPWIVKAFLRHRKDLETGKDRGLWFDPSAGQFVIDFCESFCIPAAQTTPMSLMPWQQSVLYIAYGWKRADGYRRFRRIYLEIAKKNGKTGLAAALCLYHLIGDGEPSARVFVAATALKQARECFNEAVAMRDRNSEFREAISKYGNSPVLSLYVPDTNSRLSPMARGADSQDGAVVSAAVLDELHRWKLTDNLWSILRYGGDTRKQPMLIGITTAGASAGKSSLCWGEHDYGTRILDGLQEDDEVCPFIFSLAPKDDWKDSKNWIKANPSLGAILPESALRNQLDEAKGKPTAMGEYKRYRLNLWTDTAADPAIEMDNWDACCREAVETHPDASRLRQESLKELTGKTCFAGVDLAPKIDTSSIVLLFPPTNSTEKWRIIEYFWIPEDNLPARQKRDGVPYDVWADKKFLTLTSGNMTDFRFIAEQLIQLSKQFNIKELYYDEAWSSELVRWVGETDYPLHQRMVPFPQNYQRMNPTCLEFMGKIIRGDFAHDHNPVMRDQISKLRWSTQKITGYIKPDRDRKREKIDGPAALINALACASSPDNIIKPKKKLFMVSSQ